MDIKLIMACLAGSYMYGTNTPESDVDVRGVCHQPYESLFGLQGFEQYQPKDGKWALSKLGQASDDVCIYGVTKFFKLCLAANPNIIELFFCNPLYATSVWEKIASNRGIFLSTRVVHTFAGYAYSQLLRIQRHKKWLDSPPEKPDPADYDGRLVGGVWKWPEVNADAICELEHGSDFRSEVGRLFNVRARKREYKAAFENWQHYQTWRENRNPKRFALEQKHHFDTKHAAHLYRLGFEAEELLTTGHLTFPLRQDARDAYFSVLNGEVDYDTVVEYAGGLRDRLKALESESVLPKRPDHKRAEQLLMEINHESSRRKDSVESRLRHQPGPEAAR